MTLIWFTNLETFNSTWHNQRRLAIQLWYQFTCDLERLDSFSKLNSNHNPRLRIIHLNVCSEWTFLLPKKQLIFSKSASIFIQHQHLTSQIPNQLAQDNNKVERQCKFERQWKIVAFAYKCYVVCNNIQVATCRTCGLRISDTKPTFSILFINCHCTKQRQNPRKKQIELMGTLSENSLHLIWCETELKYSVICVNLLQSLLLWPYMWERAHCDLLDFNA